ncbi:transcriptional regulator, XRE family [Aurantiacibacter atlanticus]|uniref:Transcriptional regulator, XRE family n=1 Tax=Aurantiacibacter atlanticus TaxID=1648404 RepID=A0A0H4VG00_9SPHN|nr:helix-turn-helix transcriptional regulator [Aurantiacibacter atlanticus]AKQ43305.1 transcriptional regulator, XRE family [Aurantiacibacter atlanticus]MDF1834649.1 helix-turn-helix transcriptional regulator [Alteraurantiacibacter sp. bin_em_oilr2.035]
MINRIRDIRRSKGMTLAETAAACHPPTTAQTIGRLETGMRNLSLTWMNRIGAALGVDPDSLVKPIDVAQPQIVARLTTGGAENLAHPRDAILPTELLEGGKLLCVEIEAGQGEYRSGDLLWMRQIAPEDAAQLVNRDVLAPRSGGRFAFGRLINRQGNLIGLLPPGIGQRQIVIDAPPWLAVAEMLVRKL